MESVQWADVAELASVLVVVVTAIFGGLGATKVTNALKTRYGLKGDGAFLLSWVIAILCGALVAIANGAINPETINNPVKLATILVTTVVANEKTFRYLRDQPT